METSICRFCFKKINEDDPQIRSIADQAFRRALKAVFPFEILLAANLPMYTCKQCTWNVADFYCYSDGVRKNQEKLVKTFLPALYEAQQCDEEAAFEVENTVPNNILKPSNQLSDANHNEEHLLACKAELDDVVVANEPHPDLMDFPMENLERCNASITCEDYKISSDICDNVTEYGEAVAEEQITTQACDGKDKKQLADVLLELPKPKRKIVKKTYTTSNKLNATSSTINTNAGREVSCPQCDKTFKNKKNLGRHSLCHQSETCKICKKTLSRNSIRGHMHSLHNVKYNGQGKFSEPIYSKQTKKPSVQKA